MLMANYESEHQFELGRASAERVVDVATVTARDGRPSKPLSAMMYDLAQRLAGRDDRLAAALIVAAHKRYTEEARRVSGGR